MINRRAKVILVLLVLFLFFPARTEVKAEEINQETSGEIAEIVTVDRDKIWTIAFNKEIEYNDKAVSSVMVVDAKGKNVFARIEKGKDEKSIIVKPPVRGYVEGETYTLIVEKNIYSKSNAKLKKRESKTFAIKCSNPFKDMTTVNSGSINAEEGKTYILNELDKVAYNESSESSDSNQNNENKTYKDLGWNLGIYELSSYDKAMPLILSGKNSKVLELPIKLNGYLGVYVGYMSNTQEFKITCNNNEKLIKPYTKSREAKGEKFINERFVDAENFQDATLKIIPIEGKTAKIAYIKIVSLSEKQIAALSKTKAKSRKVIYDNDGYSDFFLGKYPDSHTLAQFPSNLKEKTNAKEISWTLGTTGFLTYDSAYAGPAYEGFEKYEEYVRNGDKIAKEQILNILQEGKSPIEIVASSGDDLGIDVNATLRMDAFYNADYVKFLNGKIYEELLNFRQNDSIRLSYYYEEVRNYILNILKEACSISGVDGITLDFCRYPEVIGSEAETKEKIEIMNEFMEDVRREIPDKKITVRFPHIKPENYGLDIKTWVENGYVDRIVPSDISLESFYDISEYVELVKNTDVEIFAGITANLKGADATPGNEDLDSDGKIPGNEFLSPEEYMFRAHEVYEAGVDGVFLFNIFNDIDITEDVPSEFKRLQNKNEVDKWYELEYPSYAINYKVKWYF